MALYGYARVSTSEQDFTLQEQALRAAGCEVEYAQVQNAFNRLIMPSVDRKLAQKLHKRWLAPADTRPKKRR